MDTDKILRSIERYINQLFQIMPRKNGLILMKRFGNWHNVGLRLVYSNGMCILVHYL